MSAQRIGRTVDMEMSLSDSRPRITIGTELHSVPQYRGSSTPPILGDGVQLRRHQPNSHSAVEPFDGEFECEFDGDSPRRIGVKYPMAITVNGERHEVLVDSRKTLLRLLREDLGLTGTKEGCGEGECGACAVILDGNLVNSCLTLALEADGSDVVTIEGLARGGELHPVQKAFIAHGAIQCGFCTPGMILAAKALLDENPNPTEAEIRDAIAGHICRCTGYSKIIEAIQAAAQTSAR